MPDFNSSGSSVVLWPAPGVVLAGALGSAVETVLNPQLQINIKVTVRNLESRAPEGTWPACCALPQRASVTPSLSLHFSPSPPKKLGHWFELGFYVPPGTHVITSEARCAGDQFVSCGSDHALFDVVPTAMEAFKPYTPVALPQPSLPFPPGTGPATKMRLCYFGSLSVVDGVKTSWMEQWRFMAARGWDITYVTSTAEPLPLLLNALHAVQATIVGAHLPVLPAVLSMDDANSFVSDMRFTLHSFGNLENFRRGLEDLKHHQDITERTLIKYAWLLECWEVLVNSIAGCEVLVIAAGDATDRLIMEAARLAEVRSTMCDLTSLAVPSVALGSASVYVGPSSFAVDTARKLYDATFGENGADLHLEGTGAHPLAPSCSVQLSAAGAVEEVCSASTGGDGGGDGSHVGAVDMELPETSRGFRQRTAVINLGVDLAHFSLQDPVGTRARRGSLDGVKTIGFVGRLSSEKSVGLALHAMQHLVSKFPSVRLAIMGSGFLEPYLKELAVTLNVTDVVEFVGFVPPDLLPTMLEAMDIVVFPSLRAPAETFAIVNVEAMAMEVPVVGFGVPGTLDYLQHGLNGFVAPHVTPSSLAEQLEKLVADPALAVRMGAAGRALVEARFRQDVTSTSYELLFRCMRLCQAVTDLPCARRCARTVTHSKR